MCGAAYFCGIVKKETKQPKEQENLHYMKSEIKSGEFYLPESEIVFGVGVSIPENADR